MGKFVKLNPTELKALRNVDPRLVSYNVEMTEVTGGTFWKAYTPEQVDGTEEFPVIKDWSNMGNLQQWYDPIDTTNPRLIKLAKELGANDELPALEPVQQPAGTMEIVSGSCVFLVM